MSDATPILDWSNGTDGIAYQRCGPCGHLWYFAREFCAACGSVAITQHQASGLGRVATTTVVARAPSDRWKAHAPYALALIDADEGFRLMAHVEADARIGDRVRASHVRFDDVLIPVFTRTEP